jgi:predicted SnoaL-like aldol condensation-catalyzing enzyme
MKSAVFAQAVASLLAFASAASYCPSRAATDAEQLTILNEFVDKFYVKHNVTQALMDHIDVNYIEHDPNGLSGRQNAINGLVNFIPLTNQTIMHKAMFNGVGWLHFREDAPGSPYTNAIVDVFRFNGTCIMEHWDVSQPKMPNATNPLAMW